MTVSYMGTICLKHAEDFERDIGDNALLALVPEYTAAMVLNYIDGDEFDYNIDTLVKNIATASDGCPFCYLDKTDLYKDVVAKINGQKQKVNKDGKRD